MTPQISPVASRYANAFVDTIVENKAQKAVASDIESLKSIYVDSPEFADFTSNAVISRDEKRSVIEAMAKKAKFHDLTVNFLKLLIENGRLGNLVEMINAYDVVMDERAGNTIVSVVSAFPLKAAQEKKIKAELDIFRNRKAIKIRHNQLEKIKIVPDKELIKKFPDEIFVPKNVSEPIFNQLFNNILSALSKKVKKKII